MVHLVVTILDQSRRVARLWAVDTDILTAKARAGMYEQDGHAVVLWGPQDIKGWTLLA